MNINIWNIIIPTISGLVGVLIGSLKPFVDWNIEKKREKLNAKRMMIANWRNKIEDEFDASDFRETVEFSQMKNHLSEQLEKQLNPPDKTEDGVPVLNIRSVIGRESIKDRLLSEITLIEKKWKLI